MTMLVLTTKQMKRAEQLTDQSGLSYMDMMRNAGLKAFEYCNEKFGILNKKCVILCGNGNNAGDGFVIAKKLSQNKSNVCIVMCCSAPRTEESTVAFQDLNVHTVETLDLLENEVLVKNNIDEADIIIDAIYGTGFHGELNNDISSLIEYVNNSAAIRIAIDIPSGINADTGDCGSVNFIADTTLTFATLKPVHIMDKAKNSCGHIEVLDIGIDKEVIQMAYFNVVVLTEKMISLIIPKRKPDSHKGNYGKFLNISGSKTMGGAAMMSTLAAMRIGAGTTTLATTKSVATICASSMMEAMTLPLEETETGCISFCSVDEIAQKLKVSTSVLLGCGLSVTLDTKQVVEYVIKNTDCSMVLDADALNCISCDLNLLKHLKCLSIITPHIGEMARLTSKSIDDVLASPYEIAQVFAKKYNVIVVLKGHKTIIATPNGEIYQNSTGNAGLAKGGSGDVLAGMIAGLLAQGIDAENAAICGVYLHGKAADSVAMRMSQYSMLARDIIEEISVVLKAMDR